MLKEHNIDVARRTVAKYREALGILPLGKEKNPTEPTLIDFENFFAIKFCFSGR